MIQSVTIKNFRGFRELKVGPLDRVNLIAGKNNTGKTALLEALYLHLNPNNCRLALEMNKTRGLSRVVESVGSRDSDAIRSLSRWLCFEGQPENVITLKSQTEGNRQRISTLRVDETQTAKMFHSSEIWESSTREAMKDHPFFELFHPYILHQYQDANKRVGFSAFGVGPSQLATTSFSHGIDESPPSRYLESSGRPSDTDINEYSEVEVTGRQGELVSSLQKLEPRLERLSLIVIAGEPEIHGDLGQQRLVPIAYIGEGFRRLLSILLAIANCQGGAVLIDEIENGIHHSILEDVWSAIAEMARKADVQVFATTHSYECITAAHRAFQSDGTYDLRLHRLERENDQVRSVTYDQESLETSVAFHWEVR